MMMRSTLFCLLCILVVEVTSETLPSVTFFRYTLVNHDYINLTLVGSDDDGRNSLKCHTDLYTGDWFAPNDSRVPFDGAVYKTFTEKRVDLRRRSNVSLTSGIYRCTIETIAVESSDDKSDPSSTQESLYVGLYTRGGIYNNISLQKYIVDGCFEQCMWLYASVALHDYNLTWYSKDV